MFTILLILCNSVLLIGLITLYIKYTKEVDPINKEIIEAQFIKRKVWDALMKFCETFKIPVTYRSEGTGGFEYETEACGLMNYKSPCTAYWMINGIEIQIKDFGLQSVFTATLSVFAHEVGHCIAIVEYRDFSEEAASAAAYKFIKETLTEKELKNSYFQIFLESFFEDGLDYEFKPTYPEYEYREYISKEIKDYENAKENKE